MPFLRFQQARQSSGWRHLLSACGLLALLLGAACEGRRPEGAPPPDPDPAPDPGPLFVEGAKGAGIDFVHFNGMTGELFFVENMGAGAAVFDMDGDGDLDIFLVQGAHLDPAKGLEEAVIVTPPTLPLMDRLYRNEGPGDDGMPRFSDVTEASGIAGREYGMGVATGDYDGDGHVDLYVSNFGPNRLWRNRGDGTFVDETERAGVGDTRWSTAASFFDFDGDGRLDLFVGNYVDFSVEDHVPCLAESGLADYCSPENFPPQPDRLFRNLGGGAFAEVTAKLGLGGAPGKALGAIAGDFNGDGWQDLYVANDQMPNFLWLQGADGTFGDEALLGGAGVNREGRAEASMGVDAADFDGDGDEDLFLSHLRWESNTLYTNSGGGVFRDRSFESGLGAPSLGKTGFGTRWLDVDNDSRLDLLVFNGGVKIIEEQAEKGEKHPLRQRDQLFVWKPGGLYEEAPALGGEALAVETVSRGAAFGDLDNDGDTDVVVTENHGPARILINRVGQDRPWIGLRLVSAAGGRDMLGARVALRLPGGRVLWRRSHTDGSYLSAHDPRVLVGLGESPSVEGVRVYWPDGSIEEWQGLGPGRYHSLRQGEGRIRSESNP